MVKIIISIIKKSLTLNILKKVQDDSKVDTIKNIILNIIYFVIYFLAGIFILDLFGVNTSSLIATAGIGGIAIAFGSQQLVKDFIMGTLIILEDQFRVGEYISVGGVDGYVIETGLRVTKLKDFSGRLHIIQNGDIRLVTNMSRTPQRAKVTVLLPLNSDLEKINKALNEIFKECNNKFKHITEAPKIYGITKLNDLTFELTIYVKASNEEHFAIETYVRKRILEQFPKDEINFLSVKGVINDEV